MYNVCGRNIAYEEFLFEQDLGLKWSASVRFCLVFFRKILVPPLEYRVKFGCYTLDDLIFVSKVSIPNFSLLVSLEVA